MPSLDGQCAATALTADLKIPFQLRDDLYRVDDTHVHEALREALVNALIHADYEGRASLQVLKEPGGFTLRNPGGLRLSLEQIRAGGLSDCRNRTLQQMFRMLGLGEQAGSGFSRILRAWREQQWQVPALTEDIENDVTTLRLSMVSLLPADVLTALEDRFGAAFRELDENGRMALVLAAAENGVTHERLMQVASGHSRDLTLLFQSLIRKGLLEQDRPGRGCTYHLPGESGAVAGVQPLLPGVEQTQRGSAEEGSPQSSPQSSPQTGADSQQSASRQGRQWAPAAEVRGQILRLCEGGFKTVAELAAALKRSPATIQQNYVSRLVREGALERRHPETPNHPNQAYRTTGSRQTEEGGPA